MSAFNSISVKMKINAEYFFEVKLLHYGQINKHVLSITSVKTSKNAFHLHPDPICFTSTSTLCTENVEKFSL